MGLDSLQDQIDRLWDVKSKISSINTAINVYLSEKPEQKEIESSLELLGHNCYEAIVTLRDVTMELARTIQGTDIVIEEFKKIYEIVNFQNKVIRRLVKDNPDSAAMFLTDSNKELREYVQEVLKEDE